MLLPLKVFPHCLNAVVGLQFGGSLCILEAHSLEARVEVGHEHGIKPFAAVVFAHSHQQHIKSVARFPENGLQKMKPSKRKQLSTTLLERGGKVRHCHSCCNQFPILVLNKADHARVEQSEIEFGVGVNLFIREQ